jgi:hypothetical protein
MSIAKSTTGKPTTLEIVIEKNDGLLWGRIEDKGNFMPTPYGKTTKEVIQNLKSLITDYVQNEGKKDKFWSQLDLNNVRFEFSYDLQAYFQEHDYLKISSVADQAGLNPGLMRQYASGVKYPSEEQANKIRKAISKIANELIRDAIHIA